MAPAHEAADSVEVTATVAPDTTESLDPKAKLDQVVRGLELTRLKTEKKYEEGGFTAQEARALSSFKEKIAKFNQDFEAKIKNIPAPAATAEGAVSPDVTALISSMTTEAETLQTEIGAEVAPDGTDKEKELNARVEKVKKPFMEKILQDMPHALEELNQMVPGFMEGFTPPGTADQFLATKFGDRFMTELLTRIPESDLKLIEDGKMPPGTKENIKAVWEACATSMGFENMGNPDEKEKGLIKGLKLGDKTFGDIFGANSQILETFSRLYKIEPGELNPQTKLPNGIRIDGIAVTDIQGLANFFSPEQRKLFESVITGPETDETVKKNLKLLNDGAGVENGMLGKLQNVQATLEQRIAEGGGKGPEKMGAAEMIGSLIQLYVALKDAMESGDWATLNDVMKDFSEGKNPAAEMEKCKKTYEKVLTPDKIAKEPANNLLEAYLHPRGPEADALVKGGGEGESVDRYRSVIRPILRKQFEAKLGMKIDQITEEGDRTIIDGNKNGKGLSLAVYMAGDQMMVEERGLTIGKGEAKGEKTYERDDNPIRPALTVGGTRTLTDVVTALSTTAPAPAPTPDKPLKNEPPPTAEFFTEGDHPSPDQITKAIKAMGTVNGVDLWVQFGKEYRKEVGKPPKVNVLQWELAWMKKNGVKKPAETAPQVVASTTDAPQTPTVEKASEIDTQTAEALRKTMHFMLTTGNSFRVENAPDMNEAAWKRLTELTGLTKEKGKDILEISLEKNIATIKFKGGPVEAQRRADLFVGQEFVDTASDLSKSPAKMLKHFSDMTGLEANAISGRYVLKTTPRDGGGTIVRVEKNA